MSVVVFPRFRDVSFVAEVDIPTALKSMLDFIISNLFAGVCARLCNARRCV